MQTSFRKSLIVSGLALGAALSGQGASADSGDSVHWQSVIVAACEQSGRAVVPAIHGAAPFDWYLSEQTAAARLLSVEPSAALGEVRPVQAIPRSSAVDVIVGPEGGWSVTEVASAHDSGAILMSLGDRTLRADAVPIVALTALLTSWGELK